MGSLFTRRKTDARSEKKAVKSGKPGKTVRPAAKLPANGIYALIGATGGVGTTSAACALAVDLARRERERSKPGAFKSGAGEPRVCLLDLDFETGACAHHLDRLPTLSHEDLQRGASEMDPTFVSSMIDQTVAGVSLISAPNGGSMGTLGGGHPPNPRTVLALLDAAAHLFDHVVIDMPRRLEPWSLAVLAGADAAMVLAELTVPSLHMARLRRAQLGPALQGTGRSLLPVLAKLERRKGRGTLDVSDVATALGEPAFGHLPFDPEPLREVINSGEPLALARPNCRYMRDLRVLTDAVFAHMAQFADPVVSDEAAKAETQIEAKAA